MGRAPNSPSVYAVRMGSSSSPYCPVASARPSVSLCSTRHHRRRTLSRCLFVNVGEPLGSGSVAAASARRPAAVILLTAAAGKRSAAAALPWQSAAQLLRVPHDWYSTRSWPDLNALLSSERRVGSMMLQQRHQVSRERIRAARYILRTWSAECHCRGPATSAWGELTDGTPVVTERTSPSSGSSSS